MTETPMDVVERHAIYFLTGFVAVVSIVLLTIFLYAFIFVPLFLFGWQYTLIVPILMAAMYFIGKNILKKVG